MLAVMPAADTDAETRSLLHFDSLYFCSLPLLTVCWSSKLDSGTVCRPYAKSSSSTGGA